MRRFRNRFRTEPCDLGACKGCGRTLARSVADGRETIIHELPWCELFESELRKLAKHPDISYHVTLTNPAIGESGVIVDGDSPDDVRRGLED